MVGSNAEVGISQTRRSSSSNAMVVELLDARVRWAFAADLELAWDYSSSFACAILELVGAPRRPRLVKPGGVLVYSTCSIDPEENEERIKSFLLRHPEFVVDPVNGKIPPDFITEKGFYSSNPVKHSIDGSFAARLIRSLHHPVL